MLKKLLNEIHALAWTLGGSGIVLITLSGETRTWGTWITIASLVVHMAGVMLKREE
jgi:hypothetical protein